MVPTKLATKFDITLIDVSSVFVIDFIALATKFVDVDNVLFVDFCMLVVMLQIDDIDLSMLLIKLAVITNEVSSVL
jgi:hypothetical protein